MVDAKSDTVLNTMDEEGLSSFAFEMEIDIDLDPKFSESPRTEDKFGRLFEGSSDSESSAIISLAYSTMIASPASPTV